MITQEYIRSILYYNPETGIFVWIKPPHTRFQISARAGSVCQKARSIDRTSQKYRQIKINGKTYYEHRLAILYMVGRWPKQEIDHINGDGCDNRWSNLREATSQQNSFNTKCHIDNESGFKGVTKSRDRWVAKININNKRYYLGTFDTSEEAAQAYNKVSKQFHGEFAVLKP